jgi:hypothetical protein
MAEIYNIFHSAHIVISVPRNPPGQKLIIGENIGDPGFRILKALD